MIEFFTEPFTHVFMQRALVALFVLCLGTIPLGLFMQLRRMSLMGDGLSHAVLPGIAIGYAVSGLGVVTILFAGLTAGLIVTLIATALARFTQLREDSAFNTVFIVALALGVLLVSTHGSSVDLFHILFGNILALGQMELKIIGIANSFIVLAVALFYRSFILDTVDPLYARQHLKFAFIQYSFLYVLIMLALVTSFQATGTLMTLGVMLLPPACARMWGRSVDSILILSFLFGIGFGVLGLVLSYQLDTPASVTIVLLYGGWLFLSALCGTQGGIVPRLFPAKHLEH